jgi:AAA15 family ATPase/GTPase
LGLSGVDLEQLPVNDPQQPGRKVWIPFGRHRSHDVDFSLPFALESSGTQGAFVLLSRLLQALEIGGLAVIDEFENDLHPHMLEPILDLFANPATNPNQAQLLFTCHAMEVLNLIHKSQVMLVQKNPDCESTASRLDAVEGIRNDDNFYAKYMAGAYGAVPVFE